jgi:hypothetical protein
VRNGVLARIRRDAHVELGGHQGLFSSVADLAKFGNLGNLTADVNPDINYYLGELIAGRFVSGLFASTAAHEPDKAPSVPSDTSRHSASSPEAKSRLISRPTSPPC